MKELVLDSSFALQWCFEDEATAATESLLTQLQNQEAVAWVPDIWPYEMLNGLGKGVVRGRLDRTRAFLFWQEILELPIRNAETPAGSVLLEAALAHNLAVYDACYLTLAQAKNLAIATGDGKLQEVASKLGLEVVRP